MSKRRSPEVEGIKRAGRLAKFIKTRLKNMARIGKASTASGSDPGKITKPQGKPSPPRDTNDTHLPNIPTRLEIVRDTLRINQGSKGYSWVEINAKNGYLPEHDDELTLAWDGGDPGGSVKLTMRSMLLGGKSPGCST